MTVYSYPNPSVIDQITIKKTEAGSVRAYLRARPEADEAELAKISNYITDRGWQAIPNTQNGKPVLEVRGFMLEGRLLQGIRDSGWIKGDASIIRDVMPEVSFTEKLKKHSLLASGGFFLMGDAAFTRYGYKGGSNWNTAAGIAYGAGTLSLLGFGNRDKSDLQVRDIAKHLSNYMKEHGSDLPRDCALDEIGKEHKKGTIKSTHDLFRRYPSEMMNLFFGVAGICIAISARKDLNEALKLERKMAKSQFLSESFIKKVGEVYKRQFAKELVGNKEFNDAKFAALSKEMVKQNKREAWLDMGLGSMTAVSGAFAMSVKEKAVDPDAPKKHGVAGVWEKIQHKPLAIAGYGYLVSTMCHLVSTTIAWKYADNVKRSSVPWRAVFVATNIAAEILIAISSKGHGSGVKSDKSVDDTVIALAAEGIVTQPKRLQNTLIESIGGFLGSNDVLAIKDKDVTQRLRAQVELMKNNPWAKCKVPVGSELVNAKDSKDLPADGWVHNLRPDAATPAPAGR